MGVLSFLPSALTFLVNTCKVITDSLLYVMKTLQVRISDDLRSDADVVLSEIGLDMPTAIRLYLNKIVQTRSIPFSLEAPNSVVIEEVSVDANTQKKMDSVMSAWRKAKV
jgi:DNA-damage-inducible protein J